MRRRAVAKLPDATGWLFTDEALQQATAAAVAAHRAARLAGRVVHDVTCSIGAELADLVRDRGAWRWAATWTRCGWRWPGTICLAGAAVALCRADALAPVTRDAVVIVDPARRSGGRRRFDPRDYSRR